MGRLIAAALYHNAEVWRILPWEAREGRTFCCPDHENITVYDLISLIRYRAKCDASHCRISEHLFLLERERCPSCPPRVLPPRAFFSSRRG